MRHVEPGEERAAVAVTVVGWLVLLALVLVGLGVL